MTPSDSVVLDASAVICLIRGERGWEQVAAFGTNCIMSAVNLGEVAYHLTRHGFPLKEVEPVVRARVGRIVPLDKELALLTSSVHQTSRHLGLSLADCACLALGVANRATVVTADRSWSKLDLGIDIVLIR